MHHAKPYLKNSRYITESSNTKHYMLSVYLFVDSSL